MARPKHAAIEYRNYLLPAYFPIILLSGEEWRISDVPSGTYHFHNCLEIGLCESDSGIIDLYGQKVPFNEGDVTIIAKDVAHTTYSDKGTKSKWSYIFVNVQALMQPYFPLDLISSSDLFNNIFMNMARIFHRDENQDIYNLVLMIIEEMLNKRENFQFTVRGLVLALCMKLMNLYSDSEADQNGIKSTLSIAPAINHIRAHYMDNFPMDDLAVMCNMSPTHFRRTFHSIMGFGALEYVNRIRITHAQEYLRLTEMSILEISEEVGFMSVSSFNRHFSELTGMTPTQYRKQMSSVKDRSVFRCTGWLVPPKED